ncbi:hypothetical protein ACFQ60_02535 [Streptomyces zhihengii]
MEVNERLGDVDGVAAANWDLARIDLSRQDLASAAARLNTSFQLLQGLQRADGIAVVGAAWGQLLLNSGEHGRARQVLQAARAAAAKIGFTDQVNQLDELLKSTDDGDNES